MYYLALSVLIKCVLVSCVNVLLISTNATLLLPIPLFLAFVSPSTGFCYTRIYCVFLKDVKHSTVGIYHILYLHSPTDFQIIFHSPPPPTAKKRVLFTSVCNVCRRFQDVFQGVELLSQSIKLYFP